MTAAMSKLVNCITGCYRRKKRAAPKKGGAPKKSIVKAVKKATKAVVKAAVKVVKKAAPKKRTTKAPKKKTTTKTIKKAVTKAVAEAIAAPAVAEAKPMKVYVDKDGRKRSAKMVESGLIDLNK